MTKVRDNKRKSSNLPKCFSTFWVLLGIEVWVIEGFLLNIVHNDYEKFVIATEKIEKLSIPVFESLLYFKHLCKSNVKLFIADLKENELHECNVMSCCYEIEFQYFYWSINEDGRAWSKKLLEPALHFIRLFLPFFIGQ